MNPAPRLSLIIAVRNGAATLPDCLDSIRQQTYGNLELIVVDGASTDATVEILRQRDDAIDHWISEPDRGIHHAWNKGLARASGDWIGFLGADDYLWSAAAVETLARHLPAGQTPRPRVVYGQVAVVNGAGEILYVVGDDWSQAGPRFRQVMTLPHPGLLHHRSLFEDFGPFDESYRIAGDYELLLRELKQGAAHFVESAGIVVGMRVGGISSRPEQSLRQLLEVRHAQKRHGLAMPGRHWLAALARVCIRLTLWRMLGERQTRRLLDLGRRLQGKPPFWTRS